MSTFMKCGCRANSVSNGKPACVIHLCYDVAEAPSLEGRQAKCAYGHHAVVPSSLDLAFFEYLGPGSPESLTSCKCGYYQSAHGLAHTKCEKFEAKGPAEYDRYYCGCRGWD